MPPAGASALAGGFLDATFPLERLPFFVYPEAAACSTRRPAFWEASMRNRPEVSAQQPRDSAGRPFAWKLVRNHVMPVNDLREHSLTDCWCDPYDDDGITVHKSLDGRELYQSGERQVA